MFRRILLIGMLAASMIGCNFFQNGGLPQDLNLGVIGDVLRDLDSALGAPGAVGGFVRVEIVNPTARDADCRVTMRVNGEITHSSARRVLAKASSVVIGPDRTDSVLVEGTFRGDPLVSSVTRSYQLGVDFTGGDTIQYVLELPFEPDPNQPPEPNQPGEPNEPPPPPPVSAKLTILDLEESRCVNAGTPVTFGVSINGLSPPGSLSVFADRDQIPGNGNEQPLALGIDAAGSHSVTWFTLASPGVYAIYAELSDAAGLVRSEYAAGLVRINIPPQLVFDTPRNRQLVTRGTVVPVTWAASDDDDSAILRLFLDTDGVFDGDELTLREGIAEDDVEDRSFALETRSLKITDYQIGAVIEDCAGSYVVYGPSLCLTTSRAGRFLPSDLPEGLISVIHGVPADVSDPNLPQGIYNVVFGASVSTVGDVDGDGVDDLLVGDPIARRSIHGDVRPDGAVYLHSTELGQWPASMTARDMRLRMVGTAGSSFGAAVDFIVEGADPNSSVSAIVGAPTFGFKNDEVGMQYTIDLAHLLKDPNGTVEVDFLEEPIVNVLFGDSSGARVGSALAGVGDTNDDGLFDYAVGAPGASRVAILYGAPHGAKSGPFDAIASKIEGRLFIGSDRLGAALTGLGEWDEGGRADIAVSATAYAANAGIVYVIPGDSEPHEAPELIGEASLVRFIGEACGDEAGAALGAADFDGDGALDLLIGAPGHDGHRGRVYVIFRDDSLSGDITLNQVGISVAGLVLDGVAPGDRFGASLTGAGNYLALDSRGELSGGEALLIGAPNAESLRGILYYVEGAQGSGIRSIASLGTCDLRGWEFIGASPGQRVGFSASGRGDLNRDGLADVAVGAPGSAENQSSAVYLLFSSDTRLGTGTPTPHDPNSVGHGNGTAHPFFP